MCDVNIFHGEDFQAKPLQTGNGVKLCIKCDTYADLARAVYYNEVQLKWLSDGVYYDPDRKCIVAEHTTEFSTEETSIEERRE